MATSALPAVLDALVSALRASPALAAVTVYDGPAPTSATDLDMIVIGDDDDQEAGSPAGLTEQSWNGLGAKRRDESIEIRCAAVSWSGDVEIKPLRDRVFALTAAVETVLRAGPSLSGACQWSEFARVDELRQEQTDRGAVVSALFTVSARARI